MKLSEIIAKYSSQDEFLSALKSEVIKLGTENPDFIYNPGNLGLCSYNGPAYRTNNTDWLNPIKKTVGPECKGCIFGQALQNMGWNPEEELIGSISTVLRNHEFHYTKLDVFQEIQNDQDKGLSWGEAIKPLFRKVV